MGTIITSIHDPSSLSGIPVGAIWRNPETGQCKIWTATSPDSFAWVDEQPSLPVDPAIPPIDENGAPLTEEEIALLTANRSNEGKSDV